MANTFVDHTGDNTTTSFSFTFPYLDDSHIVVQVDEASVAGGSFVTKTLTTDYTIQSSPSKAIIFVSAPATGDRIRIKRDSKSNTTLVDFENGSVLTEVELDRAYLHNLYLSEELAEGSGNSTMVKDSAGNFNGDLGRIANVADPVDAQDVTTKNFTETTYVNTAGDTMTGVLSMGTNKITNVVDPTVTTDAATKNYVDDTISTAFTTGTPPPGNTIGTSNIDDNAVNYAKLQNVAANNVLLGNDNGAGSDAQELTATEVRTLLNVANGATANDTDANLKNRANHTGTQLAATISDFDTEVANNSAVTANTAKVGLTDNSITAARISDTDDQFLVDDTSAQKKVVVNEAGADVDFRVEGDANVNLINTVGEHDIVGLGLVPDETDTFGASDKYIGQVKDGFRIFHDDGVAKLKLLTSKTGGGGTSITLQSTTAPAANEGHYSIFTGSANGIFNILNENTNNGLTLDNTGALSVDGALSKGSGSFKINHPLKPDSHHLVHSFIEGPKADLIYRGKVSLVDGVAQVNIDTASGMTEGTFVALCTDVQCFTSNESDWDAVKGSVEGNTLTINCQNSSSTATISWMVVGERQDQHMLDTNWTDENGKVIVEPAK